MIENRFFMSNDILKEFIYKVLCKKTITQASTISSLSFVLFIYSIYEQNSFLSGIFFINAFICASAVIFTPILALKSLNKANKVKGFQEEITITFTNEKITLKEGSFLVDIGYNNILKIFTLEKSTVFMMSKTNGLIISNDGFTQGSLEDCINLANSKIEIK